MPDFAAHAVDDLAGNLFRLEQMEVNLAIVDDHTGELEECSVRILKVALIGLHVEPANHVNSASADGANGGLVAA